jgi:hypothetical protein
MRWKKSLGKRLCIRGTYPSDHSSDYLDDHLSEYASEYASERVHTNIYIGSWMASVLQQLRKNWDTERVASYMPNMMTVTLYRLMKTLK